MWAGHNISHVPKARAVRRCSQIVLGPLEVRLVLLDSHLFGNEIREGAEVGHVKYERERIPEREVAKT